MSDDVKHSLIWGVVVLSILVTACTSIPWATTYYWTETTKAAMEHGYSQKILPGGSSAYWVKD